MLTLIQMIPLVVLAAAFLVFLALGAAGVHLFAGWQSSLRFAVAVMFLLGASAHFNRMGTDLVRMVPPSLPCPGAIVTITGVLEIAGRSSCSSRPRRGQPRLGWLCS